MSNANSFSIGEEPEPQPRAVVEVPAPAATRALRCTCPPDQRVPLSKIDRKDPILRSYLAAPAPPSANVVSPLRAQARREAAGIGFAVGALMLLLLIIALGNFFYALIFAAVGGFLARQIITASRRRAVREDEETLARQARAQQDVYNARRAAWERLTYCPTDRCVVDEVTGESRPLHAAHELLVLSPVVSQPTHAPD
jgi:hypothetical protein